MAIDRNSEESCRQPVTARKVSEVARAGEKGIGEIGQNGASVAGFQPCPSPPSNLSKKEPSFTTLPLHSMGACSSCLGLGRRDRGVEVAYSLLDATTNALTCLPCALRTPKHLVYCTMILTAHNTEQLARLSTERSITNQTRNQFDGREKR